MANNLAYNAVNDELVYGANDNLAFGHQCEFCDGCETPNTIEVAVSGLAPCTGCFQVLGYYYKWLTPPTWTGGTYDVPFFLSPSARCMAWYYNFTTFPAGTLGKYTTAAKCAADTRYDTFVVAALDIRFYYVSSSLRTLSVRLGFSHNLYPGIGWHDVYRWSDSSADYGCLDNVGGANDIDECESGSAGDIHTWPVMWGGTATGVPSK